MVPVPRSCLDESKLRLEFRFVAKSEREVGCRSPDGRVEFLPGNEKSKPKERSGGGRPLLAAPGTGRALCVRPSPPRWFVEVPSNSDKPPPPAFDVDASLLLEPVDPIRWRWFSVWAGVRRTFGVDDEDQGFGFEELPDGPGRIEEEDAPGPPGRMERDRKIKEHRRKNFVHRRPLFRSRGRADHFAGDFFSFTFHQARF